MIKKIVSAIKSIYGEEGYIPLHVPAFSSIDYERVKDCLDSTFVSSVGKYVDELEDNMKAFTGAKYAVATVNGTAALHTALHLLGVGFNDEVVCQPFTFIATANAIKYCGAYPVFVDIEKRFMSLCPIRLEEFFTNECTKSTKGLVNKHTGRRIRAVVMMHSFGMPGKIIEVMKVCADFGVYLVEDAAESLGSYYKGQHTGTFGDIGVFSFNGNKIITCGGGGMLVTNNDEIGKRGKHITTTAKVPHQWEYNHDEVGFNYRLPNLNASLAVAQMSKLLSFIQIKRKISERYLDLFHNIDGVRLFREDNDRKSNYWLNTLIFDAKEERDKFLQYSNSNNIMTRPPWGLMSEQKPYIDCYAAHHLVSSDMVKRVVNIPSSVIDYES